jgi:hypothetical protein
MSGNVEGRGQRLGDIMRLAEQLEGSLVVDGRGGASFQITFPADA